MTAKSWPPPGFPIIQGRTQLTADWAFELPADYARRVEDGSLVLWRPGITFWIDVWGNDNEESQDARLKFIREDAAPSRFDEEIVPHDGWSLFSYRLRDESDDGPLDSVYAAAVSDAGQLMMAVYFDNEVFGAEAYRVIRSLESIASA